MDLGEERENKVDRVQLSQGAKRRVGLLRNEEVNVTDNKYVRSVVEAWETGREVINPNNTRSLVDNFKDWVYVCASQNATAVAKTPFGLYVAKRYNGRVLVPTRSVSKQKLDFMHFTSSPTVKTLINKAASIEEVTDHPFLQLLHKVNPFMEGFTLLELTELFLELTGNAYWYVYKNEFDVPLQLWILPSQYMKIVPSQTKFIAGYVYSTGLNPIPFDVNEIIHFKFPNPKNLYYGMSPLVGIASTVNINDNMTQYENSLFSNNCRLEGVLETDSVLVEEEFERLKKEWKENYSGSNRAGKVAVLMKGLKYHSITVPPKDLSFLEGRRYNREMVAAAYGVPLSRITTQGTTLSNSIIADKQYASSTILPRIKRIEEGVNGRLLPFYDSTLFIAFDTPVPEDEELKLIKRSTYLKLGVQTINEVRREDGKEDVEWGDKPFSLGKQETLTDSPPEVDADGNGDGKKGIKGFKEKIEEVLTTL